MTTAIQTTGATLRNAVKAVVAAAPKANSGHKSHMSSVVFSPKEDSCLAFATDMCRVYSAEFEAKVTGDTDLVLPAAQLKTLVEQFKHYQEVTLIKETDRDAKLVTADREETIYSPALGDFPIEKVKNYLEEYPHSRDKAKEDSPDDYSVTALDANWLKEALMGAPKTSPVLIHIYDKHMKPATLTRGTDDLDIKHIIMPIRTDEDV